MASSRILTCCAVFIAYAAAETIRVRASVHCGFEKKTMSPEIALMDEDFSGSKLLPDSQLIFFSVFIFGLFDSDDVLDETKVDYGEHFTLDGTEVEVFSIEPYLRIRHQCFVSIPINPPWFLPTRAYCVERISGADGSFSSASSF